MRGGTLVLRAVLPDFFLLLFSCPYHAWTVARMTDLLGICLARGVRLR